LKHNAAQRAQVRQQLIKAVQALIESE
jgi:hypothetical protein